MRPRLFACAVAALALLLPVLTLPTTGSAVEPVKFVQGTVTGLGFTTAFPTAMTIGPDGRLYVADFAGRIQALTLNPFTKEVIAIEQVASNDDLQEVFGIAFDPTDPTLPPPVYVSNTVSGVGPSGMAPDGSFPGKITKIHGPGYGTLTDIITGLSVSNSGHQANGLVFAADGRLFIAHGSSTNAGVNVPGGPLFERPEVPLSGAVLVADPSAPGFDGNITYDPPNTYDTTVDQISGDVSVYASGLRNPYDLIIHSNGRIYLTDNGPNAGVGAASTGCASQVEDPWFPETRGPDELNIIEAGNYYGHPNRNRGRFDPRQCVYHNGTEGSGPDWTGPIELLPASSNGLVEYTSNAFGGKLLGDLFYVVGFFDRAVVGHIVLSPDGSSVASNTELASGFLGPLDIAVEEDGTLYVAEFIGSQIVFLQPVEPVGGLAVVLDPDGDRLPLETAASSSDNGSVAVGVAAAVVVGAVAMGGAAWYTRRQRLD